MERIVKSAIQYKVSGWCDVRTVTGKRHADCLKQFEKMGITRADRTYECQGFVTDTGRFLSREAACDLAVQNGQYDGSRRPLFSEDLW